LWTILISENIFFCTNFRVGGISLFERFERLFNLAENKHSTVAEMFFFSFRVEGESGGVDVTNTIVSVGEGDVERMSNFTS
jgi:hypothetical protein